MLTSRSLNCPGHELVREFIDEDSGLHSIVAIHSTALGPAAGGCRLWSYSSGGMALNDALRLSRGMSYKNAMAGLPLGGGKAVILKPAEFDRQALFQAFGQAIESMNGAYLTAEDVGSSVDDMKFVASQTRYVSGISGGDPSPWTAKGVYLSMLEVVRLRLGLNGLRGLKVSIQGVGQVGRHLSELLHQDGADLIVSDINEKNLVLAREMFNATIAPVEKIHQMECDVFAPCALGASLNEQTIPQIRAKIVCGAANNQLRSDMDGERLLKRGISYVPDYIANAGGIINVAGEYLGWARSRVDTNIEKIPARVGDIYRQSIERGISSNILADEMARHRISLDRAAHIPLADETV